MAENDLSTLFKAFAKFGDSKSDGTGITLSQSDKWMKQAKIIGNTITSSDTATAFKKFRSRTLPYENFLIFIEDLAKSKNMDPMDIKQKLVSGGLPLAGGVGQSFYFTASEVDIPAVHMLCHRHRLTFRQEREVKHKEGREEVVANDRNTKGYQVKFTYDKKQ